MKNQDKMIRVTAEVKERIEFLRDKHHSPYEPIGLMVERLVDAYDAQMKEDEAVDNKDEYLF